MKISYTMDSTGLVDESGKLTKECQYRVLDMIAQVPYEVNKKGYNSFSIVDEDIVVYTRRDAGVTAGTRTWKYQVPLEDINLDEEYSDPDGEKGKWYWISYDESLWDKVKGDEPSVLYTNKHIE